MGLSPGEKESSGVAVLTQRGRRKAGFHCAIDFSMYRTKPNINFIAH